MEPEITAFGIHHTTREPKDGKPKKEWEKTADVRDLMVLLKQHRVTRLGVENLAHPDDIDRKEPDQRYNLAVQLLAKRQKIELVPLDTSNESQLLHNIHCIISEALVQNVGNGRQLKQVATEMIKGSDSLSGRERKFYADIITRISNLAGRSRAHYLRSNNLEFLKGLYFNNALMQIWESISYERSLVLHKDASRENLSHIAIGSAHAYDLAALKKVKMIPVGRAVEEFGRSDMLSHEKYGAFVRRLVKVYGSKHEKFLLMPIT